MSKIAETVRIEIEIAAQDRTDSALTNVRRSLGEIDQAARRTQSSVSRSSSTVSEFDRNSQRTQRTLSSWMKQKYQLLLEAKDKVAPVLDKLKTGLKTVGGKVWNVTMKAIDLVTSPVRGILNILKNPIFQMGAVLGISIGFKDTIDTFANFEAAMSQVKAISGATGEDFDKLTEKAKQMGATTKFTATESAEAMNYMSMAGWRTKDMLNGIDGIMSLAAASGESLATTSDIVTDALTAFQLKASDSGHFSDVLAQASASANTNVGLMGETFKYVGTMAGSLGYKIEDVSLAIGLAANSGLKGSMAGTALNSIFTRLATNTRGATDAIKKLGIEFYDKTGNARDLKLVMDELRVATKNMTDEEKTSLAKKVAGVEAQKGLLAILNATTTDYNKLAKAVNNADGASKKMAETMLDNLKGSFTLLQSAAEAVKNTLGERLAPYLRQFADWLTGKMPDLEYAISKFMDKFDVMAANFKNTVSDMMSGDDWKNADFFGKISIAWDKLIATPFSVWWDSTGHDFFVGKAASIGRGIGSGITMGLLALLGIDIKGVTNEGVSVGSAFTKGLVDGLDVEALKGKLGEVVKGVFSNAGKVLPGGEKADATSWISAALIAKMALPLLSIGGGAARTLGRTFGTTTVAAGAGGGTTIVPGIGRQLLGSFSLGGELAGTGAATGSGLLGSLGKVGMALGGSASTSAGMVALGGAGVAGGVAAAATVVSGVKDAVDAYKAFKNGDTKAGAASASSSALTLSGAGIGAAIGSFILPGLGTAIGAGIGGITGWVAGDKVKKDYEKEAKIAKEAELAIATAKQQGKYESQSAKDAVRKVMNSTMGEEEFKLIYDQAKLENLQSHFGKLKLSMKEIETLARKITFGKAEKGARKFADATQEAEDAYSSLEAANAAMDKLNWQASLGVKFTKDERENYKSSADELIKNAKDYVENKHYEATAAINLLVKSKERADLTIGIDVMYKKMQEKLDSKGTKLKSVVEIALEDGKISPKELEKITKLQDQISGITQKVTDAKTNSEFKALGVKYGGAGMDSESFTQMQLKIQENAAELTQSYDDALQTGMMNLDLQLSSKAINQDQYDEQLQKLISGYNGNIKDLQIRIESFQLDTLAESYAKELDNILPQFKGTTSERLQQALHDAISSGYDVTTWDNATISKWLGLEKLSSEAQDNVAEIMRNIALTLPKTTLENLEAGKESLMDYSFISDQLTDGVSDAIDKVDRAPMNQAVELLRRDVGTSLETSFDKQFNVTAKVNITPQYVNPLNLPLNNSPSNPNYKPQNGGNKTMVPAQNANGNIVDGPLLSWVGEDGPEAIIPLGGKRRSRGLSLWEKAGELLGVQKYANGGIVRNIGHNTNSMRNSSSLDEINDIVTMSSKNGYGLPEAQFTDDTEVVSIPVSTKQSTVMPEINVDVHLSQNIDISSGSSNSVLDVIRNNMEELADEFGGTIAKKLEKVFSNMPLKSQL